MRVIIEQPGVAPLTVELENVETRVGRAEDNEVVLVADEVSRHHAKFLIHGGRVLLRDLDSMNGTYVNRQRIVERVLSHQDELWFGSKCRATVDDSRPAVIQKHAKPSGDSQIVQDLDRIRQTMAQVGNTMTLIGAGQSGAATSAPTPTPDELKAMGRAYRRLSALYQASNEAARLINSNADLPTRLSKVLDMAIEVCEADRGFVLMRDEETAGLQVHTAREMGQDLRASSPSMSIANRAALDGEPVLMREGDDSEFATRESIIAQRIVAAMCVPLRVEDRLLGSIYVDTRKEARSFDEEDLELFASMAAQLSMAIENVQLYERMLEAERKRASLGRFLSPAVVEAVLNAGTRLELGGRKQTVTTMFCDIRSFTPIAESIEPADLVTLLNEHFTAMVDIVFEHQGTLDKYIGDELMAVFGAPLAHEDDAARAVRAAVAMRAKNEELNEWRAQQGVPPLRLGIGISTGEVIAAYMGAPKRMEFTVVGDRVVTAKRLCSVAEAGQVVVSEATWERVRGFAHGEAIGEVALKGKKVPECAYRVTGLSEAAPPPPPHDGA
jgi:adenylate cyclase